MLDVFGSLALWKAVALAVAFVAVAAATKAHAR